MFDEIPKDPNSPKMRELVAILRAEVSKISGIAEAMEDAQMPTILHDFILLMNTHGIHLCSKH
jgi:hypothetical protein